MAVVMNGDRAVAQGKRSPPPSAENRGLASFKTEAGMTQSVLLLGPVIAGPGLELEPGHMPLALAPGAGCLHLRHLGIALHHRGLLLCSP